MIRIFWNNSTPAATKAYCILILNSEESSEKALILTREEVEDNSSILAAAVLIFTGQYVASCDWIIVAIILMYLNITGQLL